jgi:hypothetical protein
MRWVGHAELVGKVKNTYKNLARKPKGNMKLGRHRT